MFALTDPPSGNVVSLDELKLDLGITGDDYDDTVQVWHDQAVEQIEAETLRQLLTAEWLLYLDKFPTARIDTARAVRIWKAPVISVDSIQYIDEAGELQTLDAESYTVSQRDEPKVIVPAFGLTWPITRRQPDAVRVAFTAGYGLAAAVPARARGLVKLIVRSLYDGCSCDVESHYQRLRWAGQHAFVRREETTC